MKVVGGAYSHKLVQQKRAAKYGCHKKNSEVFINGTKCKKFQSHSPFLRHKYCFFSTYTTFYVLFLIFINTPDRFIIGSIKFLIIKYRPSTVHPALCGQAEHVINLGQGALHTLCSDTNRKIGTYVPKLH